MLPVFIVCYKIAKWIREITRGSVMCHYLTANDLIYDRMNTLYNTNPTQDYKETWNNTPKKSMRCANKVHMMVLCVAIAMIYP